MQSRSQRSLLLLCLLLLCWSWAGAAPAADEQALPGLQQRQERLERFNPAVPEPPASGAQTTPETQRAFESTLRAYYAYREHGYEQRRMAFDWQRWSSKVIFFVVLGLVLAGIAFAAIQFRTGMGRQDKADPPATEFVVDLKGIQIRSPVLGVVVLAISLAFFYLYLVYVYPIFNVF